MNRRTISRLAATAIAGSFALAALPTARAQDSSLPTGKPRSSDERVVTGQPTPPPANSDSRKAAEGQLPGTTAPAAGAGAGAVPARNGAIDPASSLAPRAVRPEAGDPAVRLQSSAVSPGARPGMAPAGMGVAMLIEHALGMAIEGSALQAIAEQSAPGADPNDPAKILLDHARDQMKGAKALLTQAATDGRNIEDGSPTRRFYTAANNYLTTLGSLATAPKAMTPAEKAQVALVNHSVKEVLDSGHIRQFGQAYSSGAATEQLLAHARAMSDGGMKTVLRMAGNGPAGTLARSGRELLEAGEQLASMMAAAPAEMAPNGNPGLVPQVGPNPGRLQDNRPEIIGGTRGTGSPSTGTTNGPGAAKNVKNATEGPNGTLNVPVPSGAPGTGTSSYGVGNNNTPPTNSSAGSRPR